MQGSLTATQHIDTTETSVDVGKLWLDFTWTPSPEWKSAQKLVWPAGKCNALYPIPSPDMCKCHPLQKWLGSTLWKNMVPKWPVLLTCLQFCRHLAEEVAVAYQLVFWVGESNQEPRTEFCHLHCPPSARQPNLWTTSSAKWNTKQMIRKSIVLCRKY